MSPPFNHIKTLLIISIITVYKGLSMRTDVHPISFPISDARLRAAIQVAGAAAYSSDDDHITPRPRCAFDAFSPKTTTIENANLFHRKRCPDWRHLKTEPYRIRLCGQRKRRLSKMLTSFTSQTSRARLFVACASHSCSVFGRFSVDGENSMDAELLMRFR